MFSELERSCHVMCENHMTAAWLNRQLIRSESMLVRTLVERQREYIVEYIITAVCWNIVLRLVDETGDEYIVTRFERWNRNDYWELSLQNVESETREIRLVMTRGVRLVTRGDRDLVPARPSIRWTSVDSRFVWELLYAYRVACCRDRRLTLLKDTLLRRIFYYYSFSFVISLAILISNVSSPNFVVYFL